MTPVRSDWNVVSRKRVLQVNGALGLLLLLTLLSSSFLGSVRIDWQEAFQGIFNGDPQADILFRARLPRVLLGIIIGGGLATVGLVLQALLRNPLACSHILGVSGGASLGGILGIVLVPKLFPVLGHGFLGEISFVPLGSFGGAIASMFLIYRLSLIHGRLHPYHLLLCGVIFNAFVIAILMFLNTALDFYQSQRLLFWLMGSLSTRSYTTVAFIWGYVIIGFVWLWNSATALNLLSLGEEGAMQLGVEVNRTQRHLFFASSLMVGAIVSVSGMIGFVGLIVPHILRLLFGSDHRLLLPASFLAGGIFLAWADTFARTSIAPAELPVGVVTAFLGGPFFMFLLYREGRKRIFHGSDR